MLPPLRARVNAQTHDPEATADILDGPAMDDEPYPDELYRGPLCPACGGDHSPIHDEHGRAMFPPCQRGPSEADKVSTADGLPWYHPRRTRTVSRETSRRPVQAIPDMHHLDAERLGR